MVSRNKQNEELEQQLLGLLKGTIGGMDRKIDRQTKRMDDKDKHDDRQDERLDDLEAEVFKKPVLPVKLPSPWRDPKNFRVILYIILALVALGLAFKGIDISKVFN